MKYCQSMMVVFIVWIVLICLEQNKLEAHKQTLWNKEFCNVAIPSKDTKILLLNQYCKSDNPSFFIDGDLESFNGKNVYV